MKKLIEGIPFLLLIVLCPYFFFKEPSMSQSLIFIAVAALCGYRYFQIDKQVPNYTKIFEDQLKTLHESHFNQIQEFRKEVKEVKDLYGMSTVEQSRKKTAEGFLW